MLFETGSQLVFKENKLVAPNKKKPFPSFLTTAWAWRGFDVRSARVDGAVYSMAATRSAISLFCDCSEISWWQFYYEVVIL